MDLLELPPFIATTVAAILTLLAFKKWGTKLNPTSSPVGDRIVDIVTLFAAAAVVAGASTTPLVDLLALIPQGIYNALAEWLSDLIPGAWLGVGIITSILALIVMIYFGKRYEASESRLDLLWFGLVTLAAAASFPWIQTALEFWADYISAFVWNGLVTLVNFVIYDGPGWVVGRFNE